MRQIKTKNFKIDSKDTREYECIYHSYTMNNNPDSFTIRQDGSIVGTINGDLNIIGKYNMFIYNKHSDTIDYKQGSFFDGIEKICKYFNIDYDKMIESLKA